ncbi:MAG: hypothetical protein U1A27_02495 [Phycisphaerae bacterium]
MLGREQVEHLGGKARAGGRQDIAAAVTIGDGREPAGGLERRRGGGGIEDEYRLVFLGGRIDADRPRDDLGDRFLQVRREDLGQFTRQAGDVLLVAGVAEARLGDRFRSVAAIEHHVFGRFAGRVALGGGRTLNEVFPGELGEQPLDQVVERAGGGSRQVAGLVVAADAQQGVEGGPVDRPAASVGGGELVEVLGGADGRLGLAQVAGDGIQQGGVEPERAGGGPPGGLAGLLGLGGVGPFEGDSGGDRGVDGLVEDVGQAIFAGQDDADGGGEEPEHDDDRACRAGDAEVVERSAGDGRLEARAGPSAAKPVCEGHWGTTFSGRSPQDSDRMPRLYGNGRPAVRDIERAAGRVKAGGGRVGCEGAWHERGKRTRAIGVIYC